MTKADWDYQFGYVAGYIKSLGYTVKETPHEQERVEFDEKVIYINSRNRSETRFYTLLHEFGHVEIYEDGAEEFEADHPMYYRIEDGRVERSKACKVSIVAEEIEAWKRGRWFARSEDLTINEKKYDKQMTEALMSYINWAADG
jgi:hypothetical protein